MKYSHSLTLAAALLLSACSGNTVKTTLGLNRGAPDEFRVVARPPLSVPPQFELRPPSATGEPAQTPASQQAQALVLGSTQMASNTVDTAVLPVTVSAPTMTAASLSEAEFLKEAGADKADPKIRQALLEEHMSYQQAQQEENWWDKISINPPKSDPIVNARQEAQRIQTDAQEGKPVTEGDTPTIKPKDGGVLGRILDNN